MGFDVDARTIYLARHGSHAYGLATPTSDLDLKGVCIESREYHLGFLHKFEQDERKEPEDRVVYSLRKFVRLLSECNPNVIEVMFVQDSDVLVCDPFGALLREARDLFITRMARFTFAGYAKSQLGRIERHRRWLLKGAPVRPTRTEMGLPERTVIPANQLAAAQAAIEKKLAQWNLRDMTGLSPAMRIVLTSFMTETLAEMTTASDSAWRAAGRTIGYDENFLGLLELERRYKSRMDECDAHRDWERKRNPTRAELERRFGYDTKHGSHLLRLMRMCREILQGKGVIVRRPDAEELLAIKLHGSMPYDVLVAEAKALDAECGALYEASTLPDEPDMERLDALVVDLTGRYLALHG